MTWNLLSCIRRHLAEPSDSCTPRVQEVFKLARRAADDRCHAYVDTDHIMLGILLLGEGVGLCAMRRLEVNFLALQRAIEEAAPPGTRTDPRATIPYTPRVRQLINRWANDEARILGHNYLGTEHLLLGYLRGPGGVTSQNLAKQGIMIEATRAAILACLSDPPANTSPSQAPTGAPPQG